MRYNSIKRLYEADDIQQMAPIQQAPMMPQMPPQMPNMAPPAPVQSTIPADYTDAPDHAATSMEEMPTFSQEMQPALPEADVMNLTVKELIERCDKINPLICMGLNQFIDSNREQIMSMTTGEDTSDMEQGDNFEEEPDLTFSKQMEPQPAEFSLDQPAEDLGFPAE